MLFLRGSIASPMWWEGNTRDVPQAAEQRVASLESGVVGMGQRERTAKSHIEGLAEEARADRDRLVAKRSADAHT